MTDWRVLTIFSRLYFTANHLLHCCMEKWAYPTFITAEGDCGCDGSEYGCCPDGKSPSQGPDFEGCDEYPGELCHLSKPEAGPECQESGVFEVRYHFDQDFGGCSFFYHFDCRYLNLRNWPESICIWNKVTITTHFCSDIRDELGGNSSTVSYAESLEKSNNFEDMLTCREHCETPSGSAR